ncbi:OST-HTH/LOTUS domain-containing protein [Roseovarius azorensis]|uniref:OST-HTH/LOTUS domain-containing protein n=1 Tax=Roseovarius azorensis TaxID=1287727 RepID=A0A1H7JTD9_9RHOB|nr:NYN domain-containing protein [Roseovarius azorensis]SEK77849.1 OST-HTH/LOTUS domain-containing protein [Roseovarius azorensis]
MPDPRTSLLAVLIDADNVPAKYARAILNEVTSYGEPGLRRVYGDWSNQQLSGWTRTAQELGLVQHQQTANTKGKNASDIGLVIDAMDILHAGHFNGFVLVSSDSDFTRLASRIREQGLTVIGIGEAKAPEALKNACNRFVAIENIYQGSDDAPRDAPAAKLDTKTITAAQRLFFDAMEKIDQDDEWFPLGRLGQQIQADKPDFDTRSYGKKKLSDLVKELKVFETKTGPGNQLLVRRLD